MTYTESQVLGPVSTIVGRRSGGTLDSLGSVTGHGTQSSGETPKGDRYGECRRTTQTSGGSGTKGNGVNTRYEVHGPYHLKGQSTGTPGKVPDVSTRGPDGRVTTGP